MKSDLRSTARKALRTYDLVLIVLLVLGAIFGIVTWLTPIPPSFVTLGPVRTSVVKIAATDADRAAGARSLVLTGTQSVVFLWQYPTHTAFTMHKVTRPLDVAFIKDGRVIAVATMPPCTAAKQAQCPTYGPGYASFDAAVEATAGAFAQVKPGHTVFRDLH